MSEIRPQTIQDLVSNELDENAPIYVCGCCCWWWWYSGVGRLNVPHFGGCRPVLFKEHQSSALIRLVLPTRQWSERLSKASQSPDLSGDMSSRTQISGTLWFCASLFPKQTWGPVPPKEEDWDVWWCFTRQPEIWSHQKQFQSNKPKNCFVASTYYQKENIHTSHSKTYKITTTTKKRITFSVVQNNFLCKHNLSFKGIL